MLKPPGAAEEGQHEGSIPRDGIVIVVGHAEFKGNPDGSFPGQLYYLETPDGMIQQTLLVANNNSYGQLDTNVPTLEKDIVDRYSGALSLTNEGIAKIVSDHKNFIKEKSNINLDSLVEPIKTRAKNFFEKPALFSTDSGVFAERLWYFSNQEKENPLRHGTILLLYKKPIKIVTEIGIEMGTKNVFTRLFSRQLASGTFQITKSELLEHIREKYELENILLVDYGCTICNGLTQYSLNQIAIGAFGGTKKKRKKKRIRKTRKSRINKRRNRTRRTV